MTHYIEQTQEQVNARVDAIWREFCRPPSVESVAALERKRDALRLALVDLAVELHTMNAAIASERAYLARRARRGG